MVKHKEKVPTADEASLSDHEWRLKMAAEGKAFYLPGKTAAQMKAHEKKKEDALNYPVSFSLTAGEMSRFAEAAVEIPYLLGHAANIFAFLHSAFSAGWCGADDPGPLSILELSEKAFLAARDSEGEIMASISPRLMDAIAQHMSGEGLQK